jgi:hypothetical protein
VIDTTLLAAMITICGEAPVDNTQVDNNQIETLDVATMKTKLSEFDESKITVKLYSKIEKSDYKTLFTAVVASGNDAQIQLAYTYMQALINGDQTLAGATDDKKYPGIITFDIICKKL